MGKSVIRTVLVIGVNHEEIAKKYSSDTKVEPYVKAKRKDAKMAQKKHLAFIEKLLNTDIIKFNEVQKQLYKDLYLEIKGMSDFDYFMYITKGCKYDEETFDAYTTENPNAYYKYEKCYDERLKKYNEEAPFSNPFKLKDGTLAYTAKFNDIDWDKMHMFNTDIYQSAWELVVDDREPENDTEKQIKDTMSKRTAYFDNFSDKEEYVRHSCAFWCYGVATDEKYEELSYDVSDKEWVAKFYDKYIKDLKGNPTLSIYEVRSLND